MSANGVPVIRIGSKGKRTFAIGDEDRGPGSEPFTIDVVVVHNQWYALDRSFRDAENKIEPGRREEWNRAAWSFVHSLTVSEKSPQGLTDLTQAEVLEFLRRLTDEVSALTDFFAPKPKDESPSPENSTTLRYST